MHHVEGGWSNRHQFLPLALSSALWICCCPPPPTSTLPTAQHCTEKLAELWLARAQANCEGLDASYLEGPRMEALLKGFLPLLALLLLNLSWAQTSHEALPTCWHEILVREKRISLIADGIMRIPNTQCMVYLPTLNLPKLPKLPSFVRQETIDWVFWPWV